MKNFLSIFAVLVALCFTTATFAQCAKSQAGAACCKDKNKAQATANPTQIIPASTTATGENTTKAGACGKPAGACCKDKAGASAAACAGHAGMTTVGATEGKTCQGHAAGAACCKDKKSAKAKGKKVRAEKLVLNNGATPSVKEVKSTGHQATPQR